MTVACATRTAGFCTPAHFRRRLRALTWRRLADFMAHSAPLEALRVALRSAGDVRIEHGPPIAACRPEVQIDESP